MADYFILIVVDELSKGGRFSGEKTFWKLANRIGLQRWQCSLRDSKISCENNEGNEFIRVIVPLGSGAFRAVTGIKAAIENVRGYCFTSKDCQSTEIRSKGIVGEYKTSRTRFGITIKKGDPKYGWIKSIRQPNIPPNVKWIIPTLDPRSIEESGRRTLPALKADLQRVVRSLDDGFAPMDVKYLPYPIGMECLAIALDIETDSIRGAINRIGISSGQTTFSAAWDINTRRIVGELLADERSLKIGHNLAFDIPRLEHDGVEIRGNLFDTMLAAHILQPDLYKGLERVASLYLDLRPWKSISAAEPERYNATDVYVTWRLFEEQTRCLKLTGMYDLFTKTIMPATRVLMDMTKRGIRVDRTRLEIWQQELAREQKQRMEEWNVYAPGINPSSPSQLAKWLYKEKGAPEQKSKYGRITTDEAAIKTIARRTDDSVLKAALESLLAIKRIIKMRGTYSEVEIGNDDCIHPSYLPVSKDEDRGAAATGRLASSDPNIQNQPPEARRIFTCHTPGNVFIEADFSQIEIRIAAALSQDTALIQALKGDLHARTMALLGCDRVRAKNILFGTIYGAGPRKLARILQTKGLETTELECRNLQDILARTYSRLWAWRNEIIAEGIARNFLTNSFGRRRYFYGGSNDAPSMIDFRPQSEAADILWNILVPLDRFCRTNSGAMITTVHDSVLMEFPEATPELVKGIKEIMERPFDQISPGFYCPVELKVGVNWGEMNALS